MAIALSSVILFLAAALIALLVAIAITVRRRMRRNARRSGYDSVGEYLRAVPRSDQEKKEAIDLALIGMVLCFVGLMFPPLILVGVFPLFYGVRKIASSSMGLGLMDDADEDPTDA